MEFTCIEELDLKIFSLLGPCDLMRSCVVSRSWFRFVTSYPFMRDLALQMVNVANTRVSFTNQHPDYALLVRALKYAPRINCLSEAVKASSHHHHDVYDNISNTIHDFMLAGPWMSRGRTDPSGTEWLMYKLTELSLVGSIRIYLEPSYPSLHVSPVYGARAVRFIFGDVSEEDVFSATFTTPLFPMTQNRCQKFSLEKPLICINKFLVVEFHQPVLSLGGLYRMGVSYIRVKGRDLGSSFRPTFVSPTGDVVLQATTYLDPKKRKPLVREMMRRGFRKVNNASVHCKVRSYKCLHIQKPEASSASIVVSQGQENLGSVNLNSGMQKSLFCSEILEGL
ncbi:unnamed protein product [Eruca vesicaria subsp. sativa]|uniref:F-box domain-containing protein n=1 Tax=Eruca vesicaria subsp. sativa TaxID=29727 RepID=A0ABC8KIS7_ERUVS|nr:unnamed protein product [Eruca vesicaria subsp. sativa]